MHSMIWLLLQFLKLYLSYSNHNHQNFVTSHLIPTKLYKFGIKIKQTFAHSTSLYAFNLPCTKYFWENWTSRRVQELFCHLRFILLINDIMLTVMTIILTVSRINLYFQNLQLLLKYLSECVCIILILKKKNIYRVVPIKRPCPNKCPSPFFRQN